MRIYITSVFVDDQAKALAFYTDVLGFVKKSDIPLGGSRWLTVIDPDNPDGAELLLEPDGHPAVGPYKTALVEDGIPAASFAVADAHAELLEGLARVDARLHRARRGGREQRHPLVAAALGGKGGGKPQMAQGRAPGAKGLEAALAALRERLAAALSLR